MIEINGIKCAIVDEFVKIAPQKPDDFPSEINFDKFVDAYLKWWESEMKKAIHDVYYKK